MSTFGFQPEIVPSSVAKRKTAGLPGASAKPDVLLKTMPVGAAALVLPGGGGVVTTRGALAAGAEGDPPGVHQMGIGPGGGAGDVGNEIRLQVAGRGGSRRAR